MRIIEPVTIDDAALTASNVIEDIPRAVSATNYNKWATSTTYANGNVVCHEFPVAFPYVSTIGGQRAAGSYFAVFTSTINANLNYEPRRRYQTSGSSLPGNNFWTLGAFAPKWSGTVTYAVGQIAGLISGSTGAFYQSLQANNLNKNPTSEPTYWRQMTSNTYEEYAGGTTYALGDRVVVFSGTRALVYTSLQGSNIGHTPSSSPTWWSFDGESYKIWDVSVTYALADTIIDLRTHRVYESAQGSNTGHDPTVAANVPTWWLEVGATNRWAMFDLSITSQSEFAEQIDVTVALPSLCDSLALMNMTASKIYLSAQHTEAVNRNLLGYTEQFDNAYWANSANNNITANAGTAPNGTATADLWTRTSTAAAYRGKSLTKAASALAYTLSAYVQKSVGNFCALRIAGAGAAKADVVFNLDNGTISTAAAASGGFTAPSATITSKGGGRYRVTLTATTDTSTDLIVLASFSSNGVVVDGVDSVSTSAGYVWGQQLEQAAAVTAYQPADSAYFGWETAYLEYFDLSLNGAITDYRHYFFDPITYAADLIVNDLPPVTNLSLRAIIAYPDAEVKCGGFVPGLATTLGATVYGAETGIINYSKKTVDDFGNTTITVRSYSKRGTFKVAVRGTSSASVAERADSVSNTMARLRDTPVVYQGTDEYASTWVFGFQRDFNVSIDYLTQSYLNLEVEGLV